MIAVDASALCAILMNEPERVLFTRFLARNSPLLLSPLGYWEAAVRLRGHRGQQGVEDLDRLIARFRIRIADATDRTARLAASAEASYGKRTPARLNLGDCFAYALAKEMDAPLLYKGGDFTETDVRPALPA